MYYSKKFKLRNGIELMPVGYGTAESKDGQETVEKVRLAIECGYRHIDTASIYGNEDSVGKAISSVFDKMDRKKLFITTKLWNPDQGYKSALEAFEKSHKKLMLDYIDLYLIHWPVPMGHEKDYPQVNAETWRAFEELYASGKVRAIGVSNFLQRQLEPLMEKAEILPMVNQIENHPHYQQNELVEFCRRNEILVEAWSPLMRGEAMAVPTLQRIADKYKISTSTLCLKWCLQRGIQPLPKASSKQRMLDNLLIPDFEIEHVDMEEIRLLNKADGHAPFRDYVLQQNN